MIFRRVIEHVKAQNWVAIGLDFLIVVLGVYTAVFVQDVQQRAADVERIEQVIETLRRDLDDFVQYENEARNLVKTGLTAWDQAHKAGRKPPPYYFLYGGSYLPPSTIWDSLLQMRMAEVLHPALVHDVGFYFAERHGVGQKYLPYAAFVETQILPHLDGDTDIFYEADGTTLRASYRANLGILETWVAESVVNAAWAGCLSAKLKTPTLPGEPCTPKFKHRDNSLELRRMIPVLQE